jgi:hypothetical protein
VQNDLDNLKHAKMEEWFKKHSKKHPIEKTSSPFKKYKLVAYVICALFFVGGMVSLFKINKEKMDSAEKIISAQQGIVMGENTELNTSKALSPDEDNKDLEIKTYDKNNTDEIEDAKMKVSDATEKEEIKTSGKSAWDIKMEYEADKKKMEEEQNKTNDQRAIEDEAIKQRNADLASQRAKEDEATRLANANAQATAKLEDDKYAYKIAIERLTQDYKSDLAKLQREEASESAALAEDLANRGMTFSSQTNAVKEEYKLKYEALERTYKRELEDIEAKRYW